MYNDRFVEDIYHWVWKEERWIHDNTKVIRDENVNHKRIQKEVLGPKLLSIILGWRWNIPKNINKMSVKQMRILQWMNDSSCNKRMWREKKRSKGKLQKEKKHAKGHAGNTWHGGDS